MWKRSHSHSHSIKQGRQIDERHIVIFGITSGLILILLGVVSYLILTTPTFHSPFSKGNPLSNALSFFIPNSIKPSIFTDHAYEYTSNTDSKNMSGSSSGIDQIEFSKLPSVSVKNGDTEIAFTYVPSSSDTSSHPELVSGSPNKIRYKNIEKDTNLIYTVTGNGNTVKEEIELIKPPMSNKGIGGSVQGVDKNNITQDAKPTTPYISAEASAKVDTLQPTPSSLSYTFNIVLRNLTYEYMDESGDNSRHLDSSSDKREGGEIPRDSQRPIKPIFTDPKTGKTYTIPPLIMTDAKGNKSTDLNMLITLKEGVGGRGQGADTINGAQNTKPTTPYTLNPTPSSVVLTAVLTPSTTWLTDPSRAYPVLIDPSLVRGNPPVAYWSMDEGVDNTCSGGVNDVCDGSGNGNNGASSGGPTWQNEDMCVSGKCMKFDGSNDYVSTGLLTSQVDNWTISAWIKPSVLNQTETGIAYNGTNTNGYGLMYGGVYGAGSKLYVLYNYVVWVDTGYTFTDPSKWYHVAATRSGGTLYAYVNGVSTGLAYSAASPNTPTSGFHIGHGGVNEANRWFNGYIDEPKFYTYARTADQIKADYVSRGGVLGVSAQFGDSSKNSGLNLSQGLVGYWKMDETATPSLDSSGNNNSGTWTNSPTLTTGKFGNGLTFNGSNNFVDLNGVTNFAYQNGDKWGVSLWFKTTTAFTGTNGGKKIFSKATGSATSGYAVAIGQLNSQGYDNKIGFVVDASPGNNYVLSSSSLPVANDGNWHHVFISYDASTNTNVGAKIYYDGTDYGYLSSSVARSGWASSTSITAKIGSGNSTEYFTGSVDEVRIYNRALSEGEVRALYSFAPGPVAYWDFNDNTGTTAIDKSGNNLSGTLVGPVWTPGKYGSGLKFDGVDDIVSRGSTTQMNKTNGQEITVSAWIKPNWTSGYQDIVANRNNAGATLSWILYQHGTNGALSFHGSAQNQSSYIPPNNQWTYVSATVDSSQVHRLYANGVLVNTVGSYAYGGGSDSVLEVGYGAYNSSGEPFNGSIDEVRVYDYARTPAQIVEDMNGGHPAPGSPVGSALAHYKFDEGYGTAAKDEVIGGMDITFSGTPTWSNSCKVKKCINFDTDDTDYGSFTVPTTSPYNLGSSDFSISTWQKVPQPTTWGSGIVGRYPHNTSYNGNFVTGILDDRVTYFFGHRNTSGTIAFWSGINYTEYFDIWTHTNWVKSGSKMYLYINGKLKSSWDISTAFDITFAGVPFYFAGTGWSPGVMSGLQLDEFKLYNFALNADQVRVEYNQGKTQVMGAKSTASDGKTPDWSGAREYCVPGDTTACSAPIAEWKMDEKTGTSVTNDTSGNGNTQTMYGSMTASDWVAGKRGSALDFDGVNDYLKTSNFASGVSAVTYSLWIKPAFDSTYNTSAYLIDWRLTAGDNNRIRLVWSDATSGFFMDSKNCVSNSYKPTFSSNTWHHLAMSYDSSTNYLKWYWDGVLVKDVPSAGLSCINNTAGMPVWIAGNVDGGYLYSGVMDEVRIYGYARTPAQIAWEYGRGAPIAWYKFDECSGTTIYDRVRDINPDVIGSNGTLTLGASPAAGTCTTSGAWYNGASGKINSGMSFDGTDDYVSIGSGIPTLTEGSVSVWFKRTSGNGTYQMLLSDSGSQLEMCYSVNELRFYVDNASVVTSRANNDGVWQHAVGTFSQIGNYKKLYLNGVEVASGSYTGDATTAARYIGGRSTSFPFNGLIDDMRVYSYALSAAQVRDAYNNGAVSFK